MEILLIALAAFFSGAYHGATHAAGAPRKDYKTIKSRKAETIGKGTGATLAAGGIATARALKTGGKGFAKGFAIGWGKGRTWGQTKFHKAPDPSPSVRPWRDSVRGARTDTAPTPRTDIPTPPDGHRTKTDIPMSVPLTVVPTDTETDGHPDGHPVPMSVPRTSGNDLDVPDFMKTGTQSGLSGPDSNGLVSPAHLGAAASNSSEGATLIMSTDASTVNPEAATYDTVLTTLEAMRDGAIGELDDAQAALERHRTELSNLETLAGNLASDAVKLDAESLGSINELMEPHISRVQSAEARVQAAELLASQASAAYEQVSGKHSAMYEAHASTPDAAEKAFYQES